MDKLTQGPSTLTRTHSAPSIISRSEQSPRPDTPRARCTHVPQCNKVAMTQIGQNRSIHLKAGKVEPAMRAQSQMTALGMTYAQLPEQLLFVPDRYHQDKIDWHMLVSELAQNTQKVVWIINIRSLSRK